jgi:23S rRNA pseudouridine1911/1915/1917 synthase
LKFIIGEAEEGQRVDFVLALLSGISRSQARRWIDAGLVRVDGKSCRPSGRVRAGAEIETTPPEPVASLLAPEAISLSILHEDGDVIVVDKPAGLVVHPAPGHPGGTLVNALLHHCGNLAGVGGVLRPGIVHRLDQGTSGVLVAAKCDAAHVALARQFHDHSVLREYRALVRGVPSRDDGHVDRPIGRHPRNGKRTWLAVFPETGRTHQIRVHLASAGLPVVGDPLYGRAKRGTRGLDRPALHAQVLGFTHPRTGERLRFEVPPPADLERLLAHLERREGGT